MRIELNLNEEVLNEFDKLAKEEGRSRKNYMERILIEYYERSLIFLTAEQAKRKTKGMFHEPPAPIMPGMEYLQNENSLKYLDEIEAIKAEKIPKERDTPNGRKVWKIEQERKIKHVLNRIALPKPI